MLYVEGWQTLLLFVEATALKEGCELCVESLYLPVILEIDSLALIKILRGDWDCPWSIVMIIRRIRELIEGGLIQLQHTQRRKQCCRFFS